MSSELTIDIQLTELGFSRWDFQVLKQIEKHESSDLQNVSSSSPGTVSVDEETNLGHIPPVVSPDSSPKHNIFRIISFDPDTSPGKSSKADSKRESGGKRQWYVGSVDKPPKRDDSRKLQNVQRNKDQFRERGAQRMMLSDNVSVEEEEDDDDDDDGVDDDLSEDEECDDTLSSDTNCTDKHHCQVCGLTFPTSLLLQEHLQLHNRVCVFRCVECDKQFGHLANYRKHLRSHAKASRIQCIICAAQFTTQKDLQHHLSTNHFEEKFYQCDQCKLIFTRLTDCTRHVQTRCKKRYPCPKCERSFRQRSSMRYHLKQHSKGVLLCTDCGLAFSTKKALLRHSFHHLGLLPYTCIRCKRHFRLSSQYMKHECKPDQLQCVACLVIFKNQEEFLKHKEDTGCWGHQMARSTKSNDIRCMECGQVFNSSEELKKHAGTHQRVMRCSECGMGFRSSILLISHMGGHVATRPCLCQGCGMGFCNQQAYDSHLKTCGQLNPAETATKKQKLDATKMKAGSTPKSKQIQTVPQLAQLHPTATVSGQTEPAKDMTTVTQNKDPVSTVPMVMLLPLPTKSTSDTIQNPQKLNSDVSQKCMSAAQVFHIPLASNNYSVNNESDETVQDTASPVSTSNILIPLASVKDGKTVCAILNNPSTSGSLTKIYAIKKASTQVSDTKLKPTLPITLLNPKNEQKKQVLSNLQILQVLNIMKKKLCGNPKETVSSLTTAGSDRDESRDEKHKGSRLENGDPSIEKSYDAQITTNTST